MADVLIVCVRDDEVQAKALADLFEREGLSVGGAPADEDTLHASGAVVVVWSKASIRSRPFLDAAQRAVNAHKAVLACLIDAPPASSLNQSPAFNLVDWSGGADDPAVDALYFAVERMARGGQAAAAAPAAANAAQTPARASAAFPQVNPPYARAHPLAGASRPERPPPTRAADPPEPMRARPEAARPEPARVVPLREPPRRDPPPPQADPAQTEAERWKAIRHSRDPADFLNYLAEFGPDGAFSELADLRLKQLQEPAPLKAAARAAEQPQPRQAAEPPRPAARPAPTYEPRDYQPERRGGGGAMRLLLVVLVLGAGAVGAGMYFGQGQRLSASPSAATDSADSGPFSAPSTPAATDSPPAAAPTIEAPTAVGGPTMQEERAFDQTPPRAAPPPPAAPSTHVAATTPSPSTPAAFESLGITGSTPIAPAPPAASQQIAAVAPIPAPTRMGAVTWDARASATDVGQAYPTRALENEISGRVQLSCLVRPDFHVDCTVMSETPRGYGFGPAAQRAARGYRARATLDNGQPAVGAQTDLTIVFQSR